MDTILLLKAAILGIVEGLTEFRVWVALLSSGWWSWCPRLRCYVFHCNSELIRRPGGAFPARDDTARQLYPAGGTRPTEMHHHFPGIYLMRFEAAD